MTPAAGYVYVAALSNGTVKVGRSQDASKRIGTHKTNARTLGLHVTDSWVSPLHLEWQSNEDALKKIAADLGGIPEGREAFSGIEFAAVVEKARELTFTEPEAEALKPPLPAPVVVAGTPVPDECRMRRGVLTPRERAIAHAALKVGRGSPIEEVLTGFYWGLSPLLTEMLDADREVVDWAEQLDPDGAYPPARHLVEAAKIMVRFECDIEIHIARNKAASLQREAADELRRVEMFYGPAAPSIEQRARVPSP